MRTTMENDTHRLQSGGGWTAEVSAQGAELCSLKNADGLEMIWQAGPQWPRHAPLLFPIVGRLKNDQLRHRGQTYPMTQHGFARDRRFALAEQGSSSCTLILTDDADTRVHSPFAFRLAISYRLGDRQLEVGYEITNPGEEVLPASI